MRSLHLFAGVGGGILADKIVGNVCVGAVEIDPFRRSVLKARQEDGLLEKFPIFNDIKTYKGTEIENAELICGGFPCQDISGQNCRGAGIRGEKSGLFFELLRIVGVVRPRYVFLENSPFIRTRGLDVVLTEFTRLGYDSEWTTTLSALEVGAPRVRNRWWGLFRARVLFPTPIGSDKRSVNPGHANWRKRRTLHLCYFVLLAPNRFQPRPKNYRELNLRTGRLNPTFVEWLQGFPLGWTLNE